MQRKGVRELDGQRKQLQKTRVMFFLGIPPTHFLSIKYCDRTQSTRRNRNTSATAHISSNDLFESGLKGCEGGSKGRQLTRIGMGHLSTKLDKNS